MGNFVIITSCGLGHIMLFFALSPIDTAIQDYTGPPQAPMLTLDNGNEERAGENYIVPCLHAHYTCECTFHHSIICTSALRTTIIWLKIYLVILIIHLHAYALFATGHFPWLLTILSHIYPYSESGKAYFNVQKMALDLVKARRETGQTERVYIKLRAYYELSKEWWRTVWLSRKGVSIVEVLCIDTLIPYMEGVQHVVVYHTTPACN